MYVRTLLVLTEADLRRLFLSALSFPSLLYRLYDMVQRKNKLCFHLRIRYTA